ncbi:MAG: 3-deoxy-8-phosphooctulonate synthase [Nitrospiraceae bacterium]|nr:MAG: 3-deoxy-8-phosphooctulonate synthase [Nitrospiraceae bacterium]
MATKEIKIGTVCIGGGNPLVFIAGPCVIETEKTTLEIASKLKEISQKINIPFIFKSSYDKANRSSVNSYRGPGIDEGLGTLQKVKEKLEVPILSDIHSVLEIQKAAEVVDVIQIPAFLCRQTDIIIAASKTGKPVNIKKGQFLSPWDVKNIVEKFISTGNHNLFLTERGESFGYNNLVVDMRSIPVMRSFGYPVVYDATHSVQLPGGQGSCSGGQREFIEPLARAAVAAGCEAVFMEVHKDPDKALCDGPNMLDLEGFTELAKKLVELHQLVKEWTS